MGHSVDRFKGDVGETSERRGGAHMGHSVNVSKATFGKHLRDGMERIWVIVWTVSKATLGKHLRDGVERIWVIVWTVSKATLGKLLRDEVERIWFIVWTVHTGSMESIRAFPSTEIPH